VRGPSNSRGASSPLGRRTRAAQAGVGRSTDAAPVDRTAAVGRGNTCSRRSCPHSRCDTDARSADSRARTGPRHAALRHPDCFAVDRRMGRSSREQPSPQQQHESAGQWYSPPRISTCGPPLLGRPHRPTPYSLQARLHSAMPIRSATHPVNRVRRAPIARRAFLLCRPLRGRDDRYLNPGYHALRCDDTSECELLRLRKRSIVRQ
jgi:hypothetical protein